MTNTGQSLKSLNTFSLPARAECVVTAESLEQLIDAWRDAQVRHQPVLFLGEGSNVLFTQDFAGMVILNRLRGIEIEEGTDCWHIYAGAGENWHHLVEYSLSQDIGGLENLALIPGCAGSAPIQNIGAYGVEFSHICEYVDVLNLSRGSISRLSAEQCRFGYRESIFKHQYRNGFVIVAVGLCVKKNWSPVLSYGDLVRLDAAAVTPRQVFDSVCNMRRSKLPDPSVTGNAGSFFKNPVVSADQTELILQRYPDAPHYPQPDGQVKLAAGWLIDRCHLKGMQIGGAAVHRQQALVLINTGNAVSRDVLQLARHVRQQVAAEFAIWLEPEVRFIGAQGEINAVEAIA
ncbi:UDP-N-acetylmuramate dehydrogenase [Affinibrenneria salicis]|uniref:UDP-N-acetylenolpyruvoylglucosamine reductase n=1 Tax=Affinibrenneria salicis TaxID=2590031 RepID=A0A5J5FQV6_9GAMM|nr:UDP-N-acetylmuramate dehydrogenase [Affinibrenneria salicis]KAA8993789.1 UDP-N-acetylmuramate dehydrogenase [Affinibrenneria salicis]